MSAPDFNAIIMEYKRRKAVCHPAFERMRELRGIYKGDVVVPLPELDRSERAGVANLIQQGLDQLSQRIASTVPDVWYPPEQPGEKRSEAYARIRRRATIGWWTENKLRLKMRKLSRWLVGYGVAPMMVRPDMNMEMPRWHLRDPLGCYPPLGLDPEDIVPPNVCFGFKRSLVWLETHYPKPMAALYKGKDPKPDDLFECVEYVDDDIFSAGVVGVPRQAWDSGSDGRLPTVEIYRVPNRIGKCPVVIPQRICLEDPQGQFANATGMYAWQARLMALEIIAVERGVFPDTYLVSRPNEIAAFIDGPHDGRTGKVNVIKGGDVKEVTVSPGVQTNPAIDRLERAQRLTGGVPAEIGGESTSNIRTGRRGDAVLSAVIDFPVQEAQDVFQEALAATNRLAIRIDREYFDYPKSYYLNWKGAKGRVDYTPSKHFTSEVNFVTYCVDDATEILTQQGWRYRRDLNAGDLALTLNPITGLSEWQPVKAIHTFDGRHVMREMTHQSHSSLTTLAHRWFVTRDGCWTFTTTNDLQTKDRVPIAAVCADLPTAPKHIDDLVEIVAWFYTEGHIRPGGGCITQSHKVNAPNIERIRAALTTLFGPAVEKMPRPRGGGWDREPCWREAMGTHNWRAHLSRTAIRVLEEVAPERVPTQQFLLSLTRAQLDLFVSVSTAADGWLSLRPNGGIQHGFAQKDERRAAVFEFACLLAGYSISMKHQANDMWKVYVKTRTTMWPGKTDQRNVTHDGTVWCPETDNGTWFAKRNGTVWITGNSHPGADQNQLIVGLGQRVGVGLISRKSAMETDPLIEDSEREHDRIIYEALEQSVLASVQQQATTGALPLTDVARLMEFVVQDKLELVSAIARLQAEAQKRQATAAPAGAPETQPGINQPGQGGEQPAAPAMGPAELQSLPALLAQLRGAPAITQTRATMNVQ